MFWRELLACVLLCHEDVTANWDDWWTYEGISGPAYWGVFNPDWHFCDRGRQQSPINIDPYKLLFDPLLRPLHLDKVPTRGRLNNTGRLLMYRTEEGDGWPPLNITGGPLLYTYRLAEIHIHFGTNNRTGSEHKIHGYTFPAELQLYGFNSELYKTMAEALHRPQGIVAISIMVQIGKTTHKELEKITGCLHQVQYKGSTCPIEGLSVRGLLPQTEHYITYEGSTTLPGCWETATWILSNKPIYVTPHELRIMQGLVQGSKDETKGLLGNNMRPLQPVHHRTVRTNVNFSNAGQKLCPSMQHQMFYKANWPGR
ncbi:putative carbonic anhydrase-like protein 2 [Pollicipes pollicipes]|uniref:putative carbonic anhydrase-like protein 2 n=1 Tax=Pollicipes pollicipes TaxID=41117 RepID=UPI001885048A|nr:putative carbonic anhydrase-like protein 2 [Pollicipes pollicipes]